MQKEVKQMAHGTERTSSIWDSVKEVGGARDDDSEPALLLAQCRG